jgi:hypothetical protein
LPVEKINVGHIFYDRRRLTPRDAHSSWRGKDWFEFGPRSYDPPQPVKAAGILRCHRRGRRPRDLAHVASFTAK